MLRTISITAIAAMLLAGAMTMIANVQASAPAHGKTDRLQTATCETQGWPYYDASCLRDNSKNAGRGPKVRIISTDRIELDADAPPPPVSPYPPAWLGWLPGHLPIAETASMYGLQ